MKTQFVYFHGLQHKPKISYKFSLLESYFSKRFDFHYYEWVHTSNITKLLNKALHQLKDEKQIIIFGDSTGANFAYQLRELRKKQNKNDILILSCPLLNYKQRITNNKFPDNIATYMKTIEDPSNAFVIISLTDELIDQSWLIKKEYEHLKIHIVEDSHVLLNFEKHSIPVIEEYINIYIN